MLNIKVHKENGIAKIILKMYDYVSGCLACLYVVHHGMPGAHRGQKRVLDPLELKSHQL